MSQLRSLLCHKFLSYGVLRRLPWFKTLRKLYQQSSQTTDWKTSGTDSCTKQGNAQASLWTTRAEYIFLKKAGEQQEDARIVTLQPLQGNKANPIFNLTEELSLACKKWVSTSLAIYKILMYYGVLVHNHPAMNEK